MAKRGRASADDIATGVVINGQFGLRPEPPAELDAAQAEVWRITVASEALEFFATAALRALLKDYCRHRVEVERISLILNSFQLDWIKNAEGAKRYSDLLRMRERETRSAYMVATKLRITNQARYTTLSAGTASRNTLRGTKPWEL